MALAVARTVTTTADGAEPGSPGSLRAVPKGCGVVGEAAPLPATRRFIIAASWRAYSAQFGVARVP